MNKYFKPAYYFGITHPNNDSHALRLDLPGANPSNFKNGNLQRVPLEISKLQSWDVASLHFWGPAIAINCYTENYNKYVTAMRFYEQRGDLLFGEDCDSNRCVLASLYGATDEYGMCVPEIIGLRISNIKFDNINVFNYPTEEHANVWEEAFNAKCNMFNVEAA